jgi:hypothetical protein
MQRAYGREQVGAVPSKHRKRKEGGGPKWSGKPKVGTKLNVAK